MCAIFSKTGDDDAVDAGVGFSSVPRSLNTMRRTLDTKSDSPTDRSLGSGSQVPRPSCVPSELENLTRVRGTLTPRLREHRRLHGFTMVGVFFDER